VNEIQHFLLVFDHLRGELIREEHFGQDSDKALAAYANCEQKYRDQPDVEIVLIGSDSIDTVHLTHANYYDGSVAVSKCLAGI
jgi:hypothetical protein